MAWRPRRARTSESNSSGTYTEVRRSQNAGETVYTSLHSFFRPAHRSHFLLLLLPKRQPTSGFKAKAFAQRTHQTRRRDGATAAAETAAESMMMVVVVVLFELKDSLPSRITKKKAILIGNTNLPCRTKTLEASIDEQRTIYNRIGGAYS